MEGPILKSALNGPGRASCAAAGWADSALAAASASTKASRRIECLLWLHATLTPSKRLLQQRGGAVAPPLRYYPGVRHQAIARAPGDLYCLHPESLLSGHRVELLVDGAAAYPAMLGAIEAATRSIDLETYIWNGDAAGRRFVDALSARARTGVRVRVVIDAVGSVGLSEQLRRQLREAGAQVFAFHPVAPWRHKWGWSVRDHRKLLIVDGAVAFAGGLNLGDEYAPAEWGGKAWHDVHVRVEGPCVRDMQKAFLSTWRYAADDAEHASVPRTMPAATGSARVQVLASDTRRARRQIRRHYDFAMKRARARIFIQAA